MLLRPAVDLAMLKSLGKSYQAKTDKDGKARIVKVHRFKDASHAKAAPKSKKQRVVRRTV